MSVRQFVFCDVCNTTGIRQVEERRSHLRAGGRRRNDDRAWVEGCRDAAGEQGWVVDVQDRDVCDRCCERGLAELSQDAQAVSYDRIAQAT